jgi:exonuclease III
VTGLRPTFSTDMQRKLAATQFVLIESLIMVTDIICIQETKLSKKDMEELQSFALADGW